MIPENWKNTILLIIVLSFIVYMIIWNKVHWVDERNPSNTTWRELEIYCDWIDLQTTDDPICKELNIFYDKYLDVRMEYDYLIKLWKNKWH